MSYEDILYRAHPVSSRRAAMSMTDRAAQFAPFAALVGHEAMIQETARLTEPLAELTESAQAELDWVLRSLRPGMQVRGVYFLADSRKEGGAYLPCSGRLKKVDAYAQCLIFEDGTAVPFQFVADLEVAG